MAAEFSVRVRADGREVHRVLRDAMSHVELISEDVFTTRDAYAGDSGAKFIAVLLYQQYFMRVGNDVALMLLISGDAQWTTVKSVACGSSRDLLLRFDMGAAGDFASEPIYLLKQRFGERVTEL